MSQLPPTPSIVPQTGAGSVSQRTDSVPPRVAEGVPLPEIDRQPLIRHFSKAVENAATLDSLLSAIFSVVDAETDCLALWKVQVKGEDKTLTVLPVSDESADTLWATFEDPIKHVLGQAREFEQICSALLPPAKQHMLVAAPLANVGQPDSSELLVGCFAVNDQSALRLQWLMGIASQSIGQWALQRQTQSAQAESRSLNEALALTHAISDSENVTDAAISIVNRLRRLFKADQMAMAQVDSGGKLKLLAVSDLERPDHNAANNGLLLSAMSQSLATETTVAFPSTDPAVTAAQLLPLNNWCDAANATSAVNLPVKLEDGSVVGTLLVTFGDTASGVPQQSYMENMVALIAKPFSVVGQATRSSADRWKAKLGAGSVGRKFLIGIFLFGALMAVPWPYRVKCDCQLQPIQRRFVASPYDGILEKSLVKVGEIVQKDQVIARLEGRQLRIELAGLEAEHEGARRRRDSSLAIREVAQSQIARSEMNRLSANIELLNNRMKDLDVRSPIAGVIVAGDMEKAQGAPLEMGQNLFEVAPLETMVAEIGIPESEIHYVLQNDEVALKINSFPFQTWNGKVQQIHPSAQIVDDQTVFIAEVELENTEGVLRPGMEGSAKISTRWSPIGWNLFHNAWESVRYWTVW